MNIDELRDKINSLNLLNEFPNIDGYSISLKERQNKITDELCVQFYVREKKTLDELKPEEILPANLSAFDIEIITDVKQQDAIYLENDASDINDVPISTNTGSPDEELSLLTTVNYFKYRPLLGGISSAHINGDATLGMLVRDNTDNSIVAVSNNHVYGVSQISGLSAFVSVNRNASNVKTASPGKINFNPYASQYAGIDDIGKYKRGASFILPNQGSTQWNIIDCALSTLTDYNLIAPLSTQIIGFKYPGPYKFASTEEINSLVVSTSPNYQAPIFRSGRTNGPLGYPGSLYTNRSAKSFITEPFRLPIQNIKSVRYTSPMDYGGTSLDKTYNYNPSLQYFSSNILFKDRYGSEQGVIIETTTNDVYVTGYMDNIPKNPPYMVGMRYIGNFSYFDYTETATYGISANKLVFFSYPSTLVYSSGPILGYNWPRDKNASRYFVAPQQLNSYTNVKKIIISTYGNFILSGTSLYTIGISDIDCTLGFEVNPNTIPKYEYGNTIATAWTKLPGTWSSIDQVALGEYVALSTSGELFYTASNYYGLWKYEDYIDGVPTYVGLASKFTHSWNLTANKISNHKFKKIYPTGNWLTPMSLSAFNAKCYPGLALSATGGALFHIGIYNKELVISKIDGVWNENDIKVIENKNEILSAGISNSKLLLNKSTKTLYTMGYSLNDGGFRNFTTIFNRASSYSNTNGPRPNFSKVEGVTIDDIAGFGYDDLLSRKLSKEESIIYLSGGAWYANGLNPMAIFPLDYLSKDQIIVTSIAFASNVNVTVKTGSGPYSAPWKDCIRIISKNNDFRCSTAGDSGTAVFALLSANIPSLSAWKCIGINFASSSTQNFAIVCRIDNVANILNISPWDGTIPTIPTTSNSINNVSLNIATNKTTYTEYTYASGRKYYNIGLQ